MKKCIILILAIGACGAALWWVGPQHSRTAGVAAAVGLCDRHGLAADACPFCHPELSRNGPTCAEHGVAEAICFLCRPELARGFQAEGDWCAEHGVPESQCRMCRDSATTGPANDGALSMIEAVQQAAEADLPRYRRRPSVRCRTHERIVRLATPATVQDVGLEFAAVDRRPFTRNVLCYGEVAYDGNHYVRLPARVPGVIQSVRRDLGDAAAAGEVLAVIESAELAAAKAAYLEARTGLAQAERTLNYEQDLAKQGVKAERAALDAQTRQTECRIRLSRAAHALRSLGLTDAQVHRMSEEDAEAGRFELVTPVAGVIVERAAVVGQVTDASTPLFAVSDTTRMWAALDVTETDAGRVRMGQPVRLTIDGLEGETFGGRVSWVSTRIEPRTRTLRVRAELDNHDGLMRANMLGRARIDVHDGELLVVVPKAAVQWEGCCNVVFVRQAETLFAPRKVRLGCGLDDYYEVIDGVKPGETVVTRGSFLLKTEIMKGSLGAGCCEVTVAGKR